MREVKVVKIYLETTPDELDRHAGHKKDDAPRFTPVGDFYYNYL